MILIGQYDSPFVRRIGIALTLYGLAFEHRPWSVFSDANKVARYNPLVRVPVLLIEDGEALINTATILDHIDGLVAPERVLLPPPGPLRRQARRVIDLASGISDFAVALFYEIKLHDQTSQTLVARRRGQIGAALDALEADRAARPSNYWFGESVEHADIAVAASLRHLREAHPDLFDAGRLAALASHAERMEALPVFRQISQPFIAPA